MPRPLKPASMPMLPDGLALELQAEAHIVTELVKKHLPEVQQVLDLWEGQEDCPAGVHELRKQMADHTQQLAEQLLVSARRMLTWSQICLRLAALDQDK